MAPGLVISENASLPWCAKLLLGPHPIRFPVLPELQDQQRSDPCWCGEVQGALAFERQEWRDLVSAGCCGVNVIEDGSKEPISDLGVKVRTGMSVVAKIGKAPRI